MLKARTQRQQLKSASGSGNATHVQAQEPALPRANCSNFMLVQHEYIITHYVPQCIIMYRRKYTAAGAFRDMRNAYCYCAESPRKLSERQRETAVLFCPL